MCSAEEHPWTPHYPNFTLPTVSKLGATGFWLRVELSDFRATHQVPSSEPRANHPAPPIRPMCHRATHPAREPPAVSCVPIRRAGPNSVPPTRCTGCHWSRVPCIRPRATSSEPRASHPAWRVPFENPQTLLFGEKAGSGTLRRGYGGPYMFRVLNPQTQKVA